MTQPATRVSTGLSSPMDYKLPTYRCVAEAEDMSCETDIVLHGQRCCLPGDPRPSQLGSQPCAGRQPTTAILPRCATGCHRPSVHRQRHSRHLPRLCATRRRLGSCEGDALCSGSSAACPPHPSLTGGWNRLPHSRRNHASSRCGLATACPTTCPANPFQPKYLRLQRLRLRVAAKPARSCTGNS